MLSYTKNKFYNWCLNYNVTETNYISFILYDPSRHTPRFSGQPPSPISLEQNSLFNGRASQLDADGTWSGDWRTFFGGLCYEMV